MGTLFRIVPPVVSCMAVAAIVLLAALADDRGVVPSAEARTASAGLNGTMVYAHAGRAVMHELATGREQEITVGTSSNERLGHGASLFTDVVALRHVTALPDEYTVRLWRIDAGALQAAGSLPVIRSQGLSVSGPVQPSPDGARFALHTRESEGLGEPIVDRVYVIDRNAKPLLRASGYRDPVWSAKDTLVVAGEDGLFKIVLGGARTAQRIGPPGLSNTDEAPFQPAISPDGRTIAFVQGEALWRIGMDGSGLARLTRPHPGTAWPVWSPDGGRIALVSSSCPPVGVGTPAPDIVLVPATASNLDLRDAVVVMRRDSVPLRTCGPVYWSAG